jgi:hypothetical protein
MYPKIRVEKRHPDGSPRAVWEAYRIDDAEGATRIWTPVGTVVLHVNGRWVREYPSLGTWRPGDRFVASVWEEEQLEMYIDIVREVIVTPTSFTYVDLYVDVIHRAGRTWSKDEDLALQLDERERQGVLATRDALIRAVSEGDAPFRFRDPRWHVPDDVRALPPGTELVLS